MNEIQVFSNAELGEVRTTVIDGEVMFVGKDVAGILGYADPNKAIAMHVDEDDKLNDKTFSDSVVDGLSASPVFTVLSFQAKCQMQRNLSGG